MFRTPPHFGPFQCARSTLLFWLGLQMGLPLECLSNMLLPRAGAFHSQLLSNMLRNVALCLSQWLHRTFVDMFKWRPCHLWELCPNNLYLSQVVKSCSEVCQLEWGRVCPVTGAPETLSHSEAWPMLAQVKTSPSRQLSSVQRFLQVVDFGKPELHSWPDCSGAIRLAT